MNKWNRFLIHGDEKVGPPNPKVAPSVVDLVHAADAPVLESKGIKPAHRFEVTLEPSSYTDEKFQLYREYQETIHNDTGNTSHGFRNFLVESTVRQEPIIYKNPPAKASPYPLPTHYGSYHQMYRVDGKLVAIGVIDILPGCVSSVYFMYAEGWAAWSLGKISAIREVTLAKELHDAGAEIVDSLYMGFYIHSCTKMRYKGEYEPSYLLDPESYSWHPFKTCTKLLDKVKYATFNDSKVDQDKMSTKDIEGMQAVLSISGGRIQVAPLSNRPIWTSRGRKEIETTVVTFGRSLKDDIIISV